MEQCRTYDNISEGDEVSYVLSKARGGSLLTYVQKQFLAMLTKDFCPRHADKF